MTLILRAKLPLKEMNGCYFFPGNRFTNNTENRKGKKETSYKELGAYSTTTVPTEWGTKLLEEGNLRKVRLETHI